MNYFEILQLPIDFSVNQTDLNQRYKELLKATHPDKYSQGSQAEQSIAIVKTAQINDAYNCLRNPLLRAEHILQLYGYSCEAEQVTIKDAQFLMSQMTWRESIQDLPNAANSREAFAQLEDKLTQELAHFNQQLEQCIQAKQWTQAQELVLKLKFMIKLQEELETIEDKMFE